MDGLIGAAAGLVGLLLYMLPVGVAIHREHRSKGGVAVVNLFFGWTILGWLVAFVWACAGQSDAGTRSCPACAELIQSAAASCRFCGRVIADDKRPSQLPEDLVAAAARASRRRR